MRIVAVVLCLVVASTHARAQSDSCLNATTISGPGVFAYNNSGATTDGAAHNACLSFGETQIAQDVWFRWVASCDGVVTVSTCGLSAADTRLAVYTPGAICPPDDQYLVACVDDSCTLQTTVSFAAQAGQAYLLRVGNYPGSAPGAGAISVSCDGTGSVCDLSECQTPQDSGQSFFSTGAVLRVSDNITASGTAIDRLCWWGYHVNGAPINTFRVSYYTDAGGRPGTIFASFLAGQGLGVIGPVNTSAFTIGQFAIRQYGAVHRPVPVQTGERYWVEIVNVDASGWAWLNGAGGDALAWQDSTPANGYENANAHPFDLALCVGYLGSCPSDTNGDGFVNFADLNSVISAFNTPCP